MPICPGCWFIFKGKDIYSGLAGGSMQVAIENEWQVKLDFSKRFNELKRKRRDLNN